MNSTISLPQTALAVYNHEITPHFAYIMIITKYDLQKAVKPLLPSEHASAPSSVVSCDRSLVWY